MTEQVIKVEGWETLQIKKGDKVFLRVPYTNVEILKRLNKALCQVAAQMDVKICVMPRDWEPFVLREGDDGQGI